MWAHGKFAARSLAAVLAATALAALACAGAQRSAPRAGTYEGAPCDVGEGNARAFVTLDASGNPKAIGVKLTEAALHGLPTEHPRNADGYECVLALPSQAAIAGYDHVGLDWNPSGHVPPGVYDVPHFDVHFYLINRQQRAKITAVGDDLATAHKAPAPAFMPAGYVLPPGTEVAGMGAHAIDPGAPEFNNQPFTKTFIYGFYDGRMVFVEPMVAKAFLDAKLSAIETVKVPKSYPQQAYYPNRYGVNYDPTRKEYEISLGMLTLNP